LKPTSLVFFCLSLILVFARQSPAQDSGEPLRPEWCQQLPRPEYKRLARVDVHSDWFEVYRIRPAVFAIYEPHQFEEVISYVILGHDRALLFDTGLGVASMKNVVTQLTTLPVAVLNSHTHFDHTGGNFEFSEILNEDIAYSRKNAQGQSNIYSRDALAPARICGKLPTGVRADSYAIRPWQVTRAVHDGEHIDLGGRELEVIFTPGHTPDSLSLLDRKNGLLFTGDTFYKGPIYLFTPETDFAAFARSIARLAKLTPDLQVLLASHNVPVAQPQALTRLDEAVKKVESGEATFVVTKGRREYSFDGFSLLLSEK
jgi:glyoxylase-like metal-dependent hydrolase (beta-lactamase superfamily II)